MNACMAPRTPDPLCGTCRRSGAPGAIATGRVCTADRIRRASSVVVARIASMFSRSRASVGSAHRRQRRDRWLRRGRPHCHGEPAPEGLRRQPRLHDQRARSRRRLRGDQGRRQGRVSLVEAGAHAVLCSLGPQGAVLVSRGVCLHGRVEAFAVESDVGAGDALLAGFLAGGGRPMTSACVARWRGVRQHAVCRAARCPVLTTFRSRRSPCPTFQTVRRC